MPLPVPLLIRASFLSFLALVAGCRPRPIETLGVQFIDRSSEAGVARRYRTEAKDGQALTILETMGRGGAFLDYNQDGNLDVLLVDAPHPALYRGDGKGRFRDVTRESGLNHLVGHFFGCAVGDYDNDGRPDIYLSGYRTGLLLHNEGSSGFRDVTRRVGLKPQPWGTSCGFSDYDNDGRLDLLVCNYVKFGSDPARYPQRCEPLACPPQNYRPEFPTLYRNLGGGRFLDATRTTGLDKTEGKALGVAFADFDGDGDQDVMLANDEMPGDLLRNDIGHFTNVGAASGTALGPDGRVHGGMGADWADYDGDGDPDAVVTTYTDQDKSLYRNQGGGLFEDVSPRNGITPATLPYIAFGVKWLDYDSDGWLDLLITNGNVDNKITVMFPDKTYRQPSQLLRNLGGKTTGTEGPRFEDVSATSGKAIQRAIVGRGLATGDYDNDGRIDALIVENDGPVLLLHNEGGKPGNWIGLRLQGTGRSNRDAFGARVTITVGGRYWMREVQTSGSYLSASDPRLLFGLGQIGGTASVVVRWPDGQIETFNSLAVSRYHTLRQGESNTR